VIEDKLARTGMNGNDACDVTTDRSPPRLVQASCCYLLEVDSRIMSIELLEGMEDTYFGRQDRHPLQKWPVDKVL